MNADERSLLAERNQRETPYQAAADAEETTYFIRLFRDFRRGAADP